jgi:hypothetical protein
MELAGSESRSLARRRRDTLGWRRAARSAPNSRTPRYGPPPRFLPGYGHAMKRCHQIDRVRRLIRGDVVTPEHRGFAARIPGHARPKEGT